MKHPEEALRGTQDAIPIDCILLQAKAAKSLDGGISPDHWVHRRHAILGSDTSEAPPAGFSCADFETAAHCG
jgi:hypothetical protein